MKFLITSFVLVLFATIASAQGLMIQASEIGIGKFHRYDNKVHKYAANNFWAHHITPDNAGKRTPIVFENPNGAISIQFSSVEELLQTVVKVSNAKQMKVAVLNINVHGMPGGVWVPKDARQGNSFQCMEWKIAAKAPDKKNYDQYYEPVKKDEIIELRKTAAKPAHYSCTSGGPEWKEVAGRIPNIKSYFTDNAQIHFMSCLVGLGPAGEYFTKTVAEALLSGSHAMLKTSLNFGLGDWSMPEGMGFWDYYTDTQLDHDNEIYGTNKRDRDIMQKGTIRVATQANGQWITSLVADQDFMSFGFSFSNLGRVFKDVHMPMVESAYMPPSVHIPGTPAHAELTAP